MDTVLTYCLVLRLRCNQSSYPRCRALEVGLDEVSWEYTGFAVGFAWHLEAGYDELLSNHGGRTLDGWILPASIVHTMNENGFKLLCKGG